MTIPRVTVTDDDGSGTTGTVGNNAWLDSVYDSIEDDWARDTYTPTWGNTGTANSIGNGSILGRYFKVGDMVHFVVVITFGSTTTVGNGTQTVTLPTSAATLGSVTAQYTDTGSASYSGRVSGISATTLALQYSASPMANVTATAPFTFGNTDIIVVAGWYLEA